MDRECRTWRFNSRCEQVPGGIVLSPRGRIGSVTAPAFAAAVAAARREAPRIVIDLDAVDYISGRGIAELRRASSTGGVTIICGLHEPVRIALELAGVLDDLIVADSRETALEKLRDSR